ncbi:membrane-bound serine protease (ClpP class) [Desulfobaculum xiamenense]|uniref:Membrane-bound serine protease (ClpP class) n=1 Tax=Desulfobaculum xiamenense TaxID=995050 RepID=A0A846QLS6_9BACT|nr:nodulation protein NfeD [Desulfobaculum xiamenense]NJB67980.1 membrane-bound serine protease (ClpP class) [Desulfobaculum xiamenense]
MRRTVFALLFLLVFTPPLWANETHPNGAPFRILHARIEGTINPAQRDLLEDALSEAGLKRAGLLLLTMDTPGGLGDSMREMVQAILNSPIPVAIWIGPAGARAASAGMFLVAASHVAGMAPTATIGAASPVSIGGGDMNGTMAAKVKNDVLSLIRGIAAQRKRNVEWYEEAVEKSVSITGEEAVLKGVVEIAATDVNDFIAQVAARGIPHEGRTIRFDPARTDIITFTPGARHTILSWLLNPQIAYLLLLGGLAGLFFEMTTPGAVFPGVFGGLCLLLALYALSVLPTNAAGILLILFAMLLFILEIFVTSYGLLSISALLALFFGSTILFRVDYGFTGLPMATIISTVAGAGIIIGAGLYLIARAQRLAPRLGPQTLKGQTGTVRTWHSTEGQILIRGEIWSAHSASAQDLPPGQRVTVVDLDGLTLIVEPKGEEGEGVQE